MTCAPHSLPARWISTAIVVWLAGQLAAHADMPSSESNTDQRFQNLVRQIALAVIPERYEDNRKWGLQQSFTTGWKINLDGLRIDSQRRREMVNHGIWKRYEVKLIDPDRFLDARIENLQRTQDGKTQFDMIFVARLDCFGRVAQWNRGVQLYSISADADARVRLRLRCQLQVETVWKGLASEVELKPHVSAASLELLDFQVRRMSTIGGPWARELGRGLEVAAQEAVQKQQDRLPAKLNRQIDKNRDHLRLSMADWIGSKWGKSVTEDDVPGDEGKANVD